MMVAGPEARIAVLEALLPTMVKNQDAHEKNDEQRFEQINDRFDRLLNYMMDMKKEILESVGNVKDELTEKDADLGAKIDTLWDEKNQRDGAFRFSGLVGHCVTGIVSIGTFFGIQKLFK